MDHCLLNPEYLNIEQKPGYFTLAPFLSLTWFWKIWAIPDVVWIDFVDPRCWFVSDKTSSKFCRSTLLSAVCHRSSNPTKQLQYCSTAEQLFNYIEIRMSQLHDARGWEKASLEFNGSLLGFVIEGLIEYGWSIVRFTVQWFTDPPKPSGWYRKYIEKEQ